MTPAPLTYNATLARRIDLTEALAIFSIQPDVPPARDASGAWFTAGQSCVIGLNNDERPDLGSVRRSMSISSAPDDDGPIELYIRLVAQPTSPNPLTPLLWRLRAGDRRYRRPVPSGRFTIRHTIGEADPRLRVLVAAGTGLAPFLAMLRGEIARDPGADLSRWLVLHGASYERDLGYRDELERLARGNRLRYRATVSRPAACPGWRGDTGRVESYFQPDRLAALEDWLGLPPGGFTPRAAAVLVCGLRGTIGATIALLVGRGFVPAQARVRDALGVPPDRPASLFFEQYDVAPVIDLGDPGIVGRLRTEMQRALAPAAG